MAFGYPRVLRTNGGPCYRGIFGKWMSDHSIQHEILAPYNPNSNDLSESHVRKCKKTLKWAAYMKEDLKSAIFQVRNTNLVSVGMSPAEIFSGRNIKGPHQC